MCNITTRLKQGREGQVLLICIDVCDYEWVNETAIYKDDSIMGKHDE